MLSSNLAICQIDIEKFLYNSGETADLSDSRLNCDSLDYFLEIYEYYVYRSILNYSKNVYQ